MNKKIDKKINKEPRSKENKIDQQKKNIKDKLNNSSRNNNS